MKLCISTAAVSDISRAFSNTVTSVDCYKIYRSHFIVIEHVIHKYM